MTSRRRFAPFALCALSLTQTACPRDRNEEPLTAVEATQALEESTLDSQAQALTSDAVEITTHFTIGKAVESAAAELHDFVETELPCAQLALEGALLTIDFGLRGECLYHGKKVTGRARVSVSKNAADEVVVEHNWKDLSNGVIQVNGQATVTWSFGEPQRHVVHDATVTRLNDGWQVESEGDRTQRPLDNGIAEGIRIDGSHAWTSPRGDSSLSIDRVQMRWIDPVPQSGRYLLTTPQKKELSLSFARKDDDTITVTLAGPKRTFAYDVSSDGTAARSE